MCTALVHLESSHLIGRELCELGHEARYVHVLVVVEVTTPSKNEIYISTGYIQNQVFTVIEMNVFTGGLKPLCMTQMMENTGLLP